MGIKITERQINHQWRHLAPEFWILWGQTRLCAFLAHSLLLRLLVQETHFENHWSTVTQSFTSSWGEWVRKAEKPNGGLFQIVPIAVAHDIQS